MKVTDRLVPRLLKILLPALLAWQPLGAAANQKVRKILEDISADNLKRHVETLSAIHSRHILSPGIQQAAEYIYSEFSKSPRLTVEYDRFEEEIRRLEGETVSLTNVVAILPGTADPDRYYVVSGHYDSRASDGSDGEERAPGAVDDASGTAVTMELARVLSQYEFDATLVFIAFTAEEVGLIGARHWAEQAREKGLDIEAMITNDIVGNSAGGGGHLSRTSMRVFSEGVPVVETEDEANSRRSIGGEVDGPARQLARYVQLAAEQAIPGFEVEMIYRRDRFGRGGDHTAFSQQGYAAVRFSEMFENYTRQHQNVRVEDGIEYGDVAAFYDAEYSARIARVNAATLAQLADAPPAPENVRIRGAVGYDTTLAWDPVEASDLAGYRVLIRRTSAPQWENSISVGTGNETTLKNFIVDNWFFAVQSVDTQGNASLPVFPSRQLRRRR